MTAIRPVDPAYLDSAEPPPHYAQVMIWVTFNSGKRLMEITDATGLNAFEVLKCLHYAEKTGDIYREGGTMLIDGSAMVGGRFYRDFRSVVM